LFCASRKQTRLGKNGLNSFEKQKYGNSDFQHRGAVLEKTAIT
jgi:hypothetical protein